MSYDQELVRRTLRVPTTNDAVVCRGTPNMSVAEVAASGA